MTRHGEWRETKVGDVVTPSRCILANSISPIVAKTSENERTKYKCKFGSCKKFLRNKLRNNAK